MREQWYFKRRERGALACGPTARFHLAAPPLGTLRGRTHLCLESAHAECLVKGEKKLADGSKTPHLPQLLDDRAERGQGRRRSARGQRGCLLASHSPFANRRDRCAVRKIIVEKDLMKMHREDAGRPTPRPVGDQECAERCCLHSVSDLPVIEASRRQPKPDSSEGQVDKHGKVAGCSSKTRNNAKMEEEREKMEGEKAKRALFRKYISKAPPLSLHCTRCTEGDHGQGAGGTRVAAVSSDKVIDSHKYIDRGEAQGVLQIRRCVHWPAETWECRVLC